jgi:hypothetical protein
MTQLTLPFPFLRLGVRVELFRVAPSPPQRATPPPTRTELRDALRPRLSVHLLRDVGLDDSRSG